MPRHAPVPGKFTPACRRPVLAMAAALAAGLVAVATPAAPAAATSGDGHCEAGYVGLTYDDGPTPEYTLRLLSALRENGVRATLFNIGEKAEKNEDLVVAEKEAGMWIANHSWSHPQLTKLPEDEIESELQRTQDLLETFTGTAPVLFRPPYGNTNATVKEIAEGLGMAEILWDVDTRDWSGKSAEEIVEEAVTVQSGEIVLMHDGYAATIEAIPAIMENLRSRELCPGMISPTTGKAVEPADEAAPVSP
ncbi:polysaccharide deacetylase family protein [Actinomadura sp. 1N219]|uniref:polysaccharide deacetylase family protein n=1 Tax=Actinomadura sp. 1N219 TaxID=3375152 RepID=UPI0037A9FA07